MYDRIIIFIGTIVFAYILYLLLYSILVMFIGPLAGITRLLSIVLIIMFYGSIKAVISGMI